MKCADDTEHLLKCIGCGSPTVWVVTEATHTSSDFVEIEEGRLLAHNNDQSWRAHRGTEVFVCKACGKEWRDAGVYIYWEWDES